jgi:hypothetical protein
MITAPLTSRRNKNQEEFEKPFYWRIADASRKYGLSRTRLFEEIAKGTLKSLYVIKPGKKRGFRLIEAKSLEAYINSFDSTAPERKEAAALL